MNKAWKEIILQEIKEQFANEKDFYERHLGMDEMSWIRWRKEEIQLGQHAVDKMNRLFTDYEKMLVDKVARSAEMIADVQMDPVKEYKLMKFHIARQWLKTELAEIEWIIDEWHIGNVGDFGEVSDLLRVELDYHFWSYKDRLEFRFKRQTKKELKWNKTELHEWIDQKIDEENQDK